MIGKYRNQAIVRISSGLALWLVAVFVLLAAYRAHWKLGVGVAIIFGLCGHITYIFGLVAWAKAKGYSSALVIGMVALGFLCVYVSSILLPPVVLLVLEDKTKGHRSHSRRSMSKVQS
jgi:hypothetical protein